MSEPAPKPEIAKIHRFQIGVNVVLQVLIVLVLVGVVNYFAFRHYTRADLSRNQAYTLTDQTKRLLRSLKKPAKIIVSFPNSSPIAGDVSNLMTEYKETARGNVDVETVDLNRDIGRARELAAKYKFGNENVIIVDYDGRSKVIESSALVDLDESVVMFGQAPTVQAFKGEQAITSALLELRESQQTQLYALTGHGEPEITSDTLATFKTYLERQNIGTSSLNLATAEGKIPADAKGVLLFGPQYDLSATELKALRDYWNQKGRLFILLDPLAKTPALWQFLKNLGITVQDDRVLAKVNLGPVALIQRDVRISFLDGSPVTKRLKNINSLLIGNTLSLQLDNELASAGQAKVRGLVLAADGYWGETKYTADLNAGGSYDFLPSEDFGPPLTLAATAEKGASNDERVKVDSARLFVVGNADFIHTEQLNKVPQNVDFALAALNWLIDREELIGIAPKQVQNFTLNLTDAQSRQLLLLAMGGIPGSIALIGLGIWLSRRR